jgi:isopropylmalate/homocitrate/citramalate synthase
MNTVIIFEMLLRDGLQSLKPYSLDIKINCLRELVKNNFYFIEYGSTTSSILLPQMKDSDKILNYIKENYNNSLTKFGILIPSSRYLIHDILLNNDSFSFVCSLDDTFSFSNLKKSAIESLNDVIKSINIIYKHNNFIKSIRIYISFAFNGKPSNLYSYFSKIYNIIKLHNISHEIIDIVFSDTINISTPEILFNILSIYTLTKKKYISLHLHCGKNFKNLIDVALKMKINKFDSSLCNIGGCPFSSSQLYSNVSTIELVEYLHKNNFITNLNKDILFKTEENINNLLNL